MSLDMQHLPDETILQLLDDELELERRTQAEAHLAACAECRERQDAMASVSHAVMEQYHAELAKTGPDVRASEARLRAALSEQLHLRHTPRRSSGPLRFGFALSAALAGLCVVLAGLQMRNGWRGFTVQETRFFIPNHSLTPGAVRPVTFAEVCSANDRDLDPEVPPALKKAVLEEYGVRSQRREQDYQIDYLINPQLGGTNDITNLWPESYADSKWNARAKDELERRLHQMVCAKAIDLNVAQREIATDWIAAYKKYIGDMRTWSGRSQLPDQPVMAVAATVITLPVQ